MGALTGPLDAHAQAEARRTMGLLPVLVGNECIRRIALHWSVEPYGCIDVNYNLVVALSDGAWTVHIATSPRLNATSPPREGYAPSTWQRNSWSCSIAVNGMVGARPGQWGAAPVQAHELEVLCGAAAAVARFYAIPTVSPFGDLPAIFTHAEAAIVDGYYIGDVTEDGITRWDLAELWPGQYGGTPTKAQARASGALLRERIRAYKLALPAPGVA